jgi:hypothetical protein
MKKMIESVLILKKRMGCDAGFYNSDGEYEATPAELQKEYIMLSQSKDIRTIKNCVVFFTVCAVISIVLAAVAVAAVMGG